MPSKGEKRKEQQKAQRGAHSARQRERRAAARVRTDVQDPRGIVMLEISSGKPARTLAPCPTVSHITTPPIPIRPIGIVN